MQTTTPQSDDSGFHAAPTGGQTMNGAHLMVEAYAAIWLCALVFLLILFRNNRALEGRLRVLKEAIAAARVKQAGAEKPAFTKEKPSAKKAASDKGDPAEPATDG